MIDSGIGIPAEHIPRLTERFYRVDAGRSRGQGGSGLGLAIVKHALQRHGGWLDVREHRGQGQHLYLPLSRSSASGRRTACRGQRVAPESSQISQSHVLTRGVNRM